MIFNEGLDIITSLCLSSHKVHIQTIGILVSEKSELQTALQYTQQAARQKTGVCVSFIISIMAIFYPFST